MVVFALIAVHIVTCWWIFIGRYSKEHESRNWFDENSIEENDHFEIYINSSYFIIMTVSSVGYGSYAYGTSETFCIFILQIIGVSFYATLAGRLISNIEQDDKSKAIVEGKLNMLHEMIAELKMPKGLRREIERDIIYRSQQD